MVYNRLKNQYLHRRQQLTDYSWHTWRLGLTWPEVLQFSSVTKLSVSGAIGSLSPRRHLVTRPLISPTFTIAAVNYRPTVWMFTRPWTYWLPAGGPIDPNSVSRVTAVWFVEVWPAYTRISARARTLMEMLRSSLMLNEWYTTSASAANISWYLYISAERHRARHQRLVTFNGMVSVRPQTIRPRSSTINEFIFSTSWLQDSFLYVIFRCRV